MCSTYLSAEGQHGRCSSRRGVIVSLVRNGGGELTIDLIDKDHNVRDPSTSTIQKLQGYLVERLEDLNEVLI
jgi:hypothetical protein